MAKSRPSKARLFVALELPEASRAHVARLLSPDDAWRLVPSESLHVTLAFLGWRAEGEIGRIGALTAGAVTGVGPVGLVPAAVRAVPPRRPRLLALDLDDPVRACGELQGSVSAALAGEGLYEPEKRPFWPHVTLARVRRGHRVAAAPDTGALPPAFEADRVVLYRSTLHPDGAVYEPLRGFTLER